MYFLIIYNVLPVSSASPLDHYFIVSDHGVVSHYSDFPISLEKENYIALYMALMNDLEYMISVGKPEYVTRVGIHIVAEHEGLRLDENIKRKDNTVVLWVWKTNEKCSVN